MGGFSVRSKLRGHARSAARHLALEALSATGLGTGRIARALSTPRVHFLYLHAIPPPTLENFDGLVARLAQEADLVGHGRAVDLLFEGELGRPVISFSFDDAFASNLDAARVLEKHGTTGTFFVPTGFVGTPDVRGARAFYGMANGVDERAMTWAELEDLHARGHEIANHTVTHRVLSSLSPDEAAEEIGAAREELIRRFGVCDHFAWPRGRFAHTTESASRHVFETGHRSIASAERGAHRAGIGADRLCLRRDHIMSEWPVRHDLYFVARAARAPGDGEWPEGWLV